MRCCNNTSKGGRSCQRRRLPRILSVFLALLRIPETNLAPRFNSPMLYSTPKPFNIPQALSRRSVLSPSPVLPLTCIVRISPCGHQNIGIRFRVGFRTPEGLYCYVANYAHVSTIMRAGRGRKVSTWWRYSASLIPLTERLSTAGIAVVCRCLALDYALLRGFDCVHVDGGGVQVRRSSTASAEVNIHLCVHTYCGDYIQSPFYIFVSRAVRRHIQYLQ
ncbi:hypothetical protein P280DRAFT_254829 [Massarina eburnea CBS 473.64]|uniref:Uncharacterized protein n=1 Tax=Massarina eburnea CBS 473.64 TaxID=1395130 RepID=A0A6A6S9F1_9PLEO|nr:hypothetical protein P280DRAFT_254829 [Massarina eburnea CBS 473.64]